MQTHKIKLYNRLKEASKYKYGSQFGETGIVLSLLELFNIKPKFCVEFGSGKVSSHTGTANIREICNKYKCDSIYFDSNERNRNKSDKKYRKKIFIEIITSLNINDIFGKYKIPADIDVLSIDIDGQDFYVWKALKYQPKIVIIEYNPGLSPEVDLIMHKDDEHYKWRNSKCKYYGASILALKKLGLSKGYSLVYATDRNCIFVKQQYLNIEYDVKLFHPKATNDFNRIYIEKQKWINYEVTT